jgi:signal transduction histidine kinase
MEADHLHLLRETQDLRSLVIRMMEAHQGLAQSYGIVFRYLGCPVPVPVSLDVRRIEQVMGNLLANASKFSGRGSEVELGLEVEDGRARVSVTNHGQPIPEEFKPRIFSKFAQADASSSRPAGGTGLGLAISKALVEAHGGRIGFTSDEDATTFWFELPLAEQGSTAASP